MDIYDEKKGQSKLQLVLPELQNVIFTKPIKTEDRLSNTSRRNAEKRFAIQLLGTQMLQKLESFLNIIYFDENCVPTIDPLINHFFSWSFGDFMMRRRRKKNLLELLVMSHLPSDCLENKKQYHDIQQLNKLIITILQPYFNGDKLVEAMDVLQ